MLSPSVSILTIQVNEAGVASTLPFVSVARTWKVWLPSRSAVYNCGVVHTVKPPASSWHSNVPASVEVNSKEADGLEDGSEGDELIVVSGNMLSIVHVYDAGVGSTLPSVSIARTWKVWLPCVNDEYECGEVQTVNPLASIWHSNVPVFV